MTAGDTLPSEAPAVPPFFVPAADSGTRKRHVLKQGDAFVVLDEYGDAQATGPAPEGLFFRDTRYLSRMVLTIDGMRPLLLSSTVTDDNSMLRVDLANPDLLTDGKIVLPRATIHLLNETVLGQDALFTTLTLQNFGLLPVSFSLGVTFAADFADIFEVRGTARAARGVFLPAEQRSEGPVLSYRGLDNAMRRTRFVFDPPSDVTAGYNATWKIELPAEGRRIFQLAIHCEAGDRASAGHTRASSVAAIERRSGASAARAAHLFSSNESFNDWLNRSRADLDMLTTETAYGPYPYAGIPWFSTAFGRDGIITALECLWLDPTLAAGTLRFLAANQATAFDAASDAEPGKILHETRQGEMAILGEVPFGRYYGSVDSTPLFVILAAAYYARTGDRTFAETLWPNIEAALAWMRRSGDRDGDGFIEYDRKSKDGLVNQGWKDSGDSIFHADGALAEAPIALVEVQAYAFGAYRGAAELAKALGKERQAAELIETAEALRRRFEEVFWLEDKGIYALALDGGKNPCRVRASNAGHVLFGGLASPERATIVAEGLMSAAFFSGFGIRTLATTEARYNPISYHDGSIWPHDNGLIALGFARYGLKPQLLTLLTGLFDAAQFADLKRLPELFCGFPRRAGAGATAYPVACTPQAWASATVFAVLGATLGISFTPSEKEIRFFQPQLPGWLDELTLTNLTLCDASVDLHLRRTEDGVELTVLRRDGPVEVVMTR